MRPSEALFFRKQHRVVKEKNMSHAIDACIFDLDGTLLDTLEDLADAANAALQGQGFPAHPVAAYRFFVGEGMETLLRRAAPAGTDTAVIARLMRGMSEAYGNNWADKTKPYDGILPMLERLDATGMPLFVLSNKPHGFTEIVVQRFFSAISFAGVQGSPKGKTAKPDPTLALSLAGSFGLLPERVLFMGDSSIDMKTATAAGMLPVGALWGFRPESELLEHGAKIVLQRPLELFEHIWAA